MPGHAHPVRVLGLPGCGLRGFDEAKRLLDDFALEVDLIVADFRLPQHENGIETVHRLRARLGDVPALMVSGDTAPERLGEARASGLPLLHKPVSADKLRQGHDARSAAALRQAQRGMHLPDAGEKNPREREPRSRLPFAKKEGRLYQTAFLPCQLLILWTIPGTCLLWRGTEDGPLDAITGRS